MEDLKMAGEWLKWSKGLTRKPEILKIAARLMIAPAHAAGCLMQLMEWLDDSISEPDFTENGHAFVTLGALPINFIDGIIGLSGFAEALAEVGWIRKTEDKLLFINAGRHNGKTAKSRALTRDRTHRYRNDDSSRFCDAPIVTPSLLTSLVSEEGGAGGNNGAEKVKVTRPTVEVWLAEAKVKHPGWPATDARLAWEHYEKVGWRTSSNVPIKKWEMCIGTCFKFWTDRNPRNGKPNLDRIPDGWERVNGVARPKQPIGTPVPQQTFL